MNWKSYEAPAGLKSFNFSSNKNRGQLDTRKLPDDTKINADILFKDNEMSARETCSLEVPATIVTHQNSDNEISIQNIIEFLHENSDLSNPNSLKPSVDNKVESPTSKGENDCNKKDFEDCTVSMQPECESSIQICSELKTDCSAKNNNSLIIGETSLKLSDDSSGEDEVNLPSCEKSKLIENAGQTPAKITRGKRRPSLAAINVKDYIFKFSPVSRLRPRTPCSRSTRRSYSAHCDNFSLDSVVTPCNHSAKKQRRSNLRKSYNHITNDN